MIPTQFGCGGCRSGFEEPDCCACAGDLVGDNCDECPPGQLRGTDNMCITCLPGQELDDNNHCVCPDGQIVVDDICDSKLQFPPLKCMRSWKYL